MEQEQQISDKAFLQTLQSELNNLIDQTPTGEARNALCDLHIKVMNHNASFAKPEENSEGQRLCPACQKPLQNPDAVKHFRCPV